MKSQIKYILLGIIIFLCMSYSFNMQAIAKPIKLNEIIWCGSVHNDIEYECDLNGNGKKDQVKLLVNHGSLFDAGVDIVINNRKLLFLGEEDSFCFADINKKDKRIDFIVYQLNFSGDMYSVYQYTGNRLTKTAVWKTGVKKKVSSLLKKNNKYVGEFVRANGDGTVTFMLDLCSNKNGYSVSIDADFRVTKKGIFIDKKKTVKSRFSYLTKTSNNWYLYKKKSLKNNRLICKLKKGTAFYPLKIQISGQYIKFYIKVAKTQKKGWVFFNTKKLKAWL